MIRIKNKIKNFVRKKRTLGLIKYHAFIAHFKGRRNKIFFKYFYKKNNNTVKIILADFIEYPLYREKDIFNRNIKCGIGNLFENIAKFKAGVSYEIILVINFTDNTEAESKKVAYGSLQKKYPFIKKVIFNGNAGFDFGAYDAGYKYLKSIDYKGDVLFMNSSVRGPYNDYWLLNYSYLFRRKANIGLCGISLNSHTTHLEEHKFKPHVQSFFMYTNMDILSRIFNDSLIWAGIARDEKLDIISKGEIGFSERIVNAGYGICSNLFANFIYYKNSKWKIPLGDTRFNEIYNQFANRI